VLTGSLTTSAATVNAPEDGVTPLIEAWIFAVPAETPVASPDEFTVATGVLDDDHVVVAAAEQARVVESDIVAVQAYCCVPPVEIVEVVGLTRIDTTVTGVLMV